MTIDPVYSDFGLIFERCLIKQHIYYKALSKQNIRPNTSYPPLCTSYSEILFIFLYNFPKFPLVFLFQLSI